MSRRQGSDVESDEDASDDEESEEEVVPRRRGKESRAAKAPAATRTTRGVKANYKCVDNIIASSPFGASYV